MYGPVFSARWVREWVGNRGSAHIVGSHVRPVAIRKMSSPPNGRAMPFPLVWGTSRESLLKTPQTVVLKAANDEELMACLQAQDENALELLFVRYSRLVFGIAYRILGDRGEAEEVVQEVF
jgi:hypothetical protein